jgi:hypothetical protein
MRTLQDYKQMQEAVITESMAGAQWHTIDVRIDSSDVPALGNRVIIATLRYRDTMQWARMELMNARYVGRLVLNSRSRMVNGNR